MALDDKTTVARVLGIGAPWVVTDVRFAAADGPVSVHVEHSTPPARFWARREAPPIREQISWEHLTMAGQRCQVVLALRDAQVVPSAPWTGEERNGFSRALSRLVMDLLLAGASLEQLSRLTLLPYGELWRYKFRLDQGKASASPGPVSPSRAPGAAAVTSVATTSPMPGMLDAAGMPSLPSLTADGSRPIALPPQDHPVWDALLHRRMLLDVRALSLKLLLTKLQGEASRHGDVDLHRQSAQSLHRYFLKHASMLAYELAQIEAEVARAAREPTAALGAPAHDTSAMVDLPEASDPVWLALISGDCQIDVKALSLKLLLTRLRSQLSAVRDDEVRMLKLVELHRYFERHRSTLTHEIAQLRRWMH